LEFHYYFIKLYNGDLLSLIIASNIFFCSDKEPLPKIEVLKLAKILSVKLNFLSIGLLRAFVLQVF